MAVSSNDVFIDMQGASGASTQEEAPASNGSSADTELAAAVGRQLAGNVLHAGTESAQKLYKSYARIDLLRPYFDVEPSDVANRLLQSLRPRLTVDPHVIPADLYGPLMLCLTLVTVLLFGMKSAGHRTGSREGTLMGTAFAVSFGYWLTSALFFYGMAFVFNTTISVVELLSTTGYGLFGYCLVLMVGHVAPGDSDFYAAWLLLGLLSSAKMALALRSRTADAKQGTLVATAVVVIHWTYLLYLQWSYASIVNAVTHG
eukprot:m.479896 g.479896  ORF g.479896 m.479896 type:complete len:259 (-) comp21628_c0_seq1:205-981(-)